MDTNNHHMKLLRLQLHTMMDLTISMNDLDRYAEYWKRLAIKHAYFPPIQPSNILIKPFQITFGHQRKAQPTAYTILINKLQPLLSVNGTSPKGIYAFDGQFRQSLKFKLNNIDYASMKDKCIYYDGKGALSIKDYACENYSDSKLNEEIFTKFVDVKSEHMKIHYIVILIRSINNNIINHRLMSQRLKYSTTETLFTRCNHYYEIQDLGMKYLVSQKLIDNNHNMKILKSKGSTEGWRIVPYSLLQKITVYNSVLFLILDPIESALAMVEFMQRQFDIKTSIIKDFNDILEFCKKYDGKMKFIKLCRGGTVTIPSNSPFCYITLSDDCIIETIFYSSTSASSIKVTKKWIESNPNNEIKSTQRAQFNQYLTKKKKSLPNLTEGIFESWFKGNKNKSNMVYIYL